MTQIEDHNAQDVASERIEAILRQHWDSSAAGDLDAEHEIYDEHAICDYPQSGERIHGRQNLQNLRSHHPGKPSGFKIRRLQGSGNLWVTEYTITYQGSPFYTISIMEFENNKVMRETQYFATPFEAPGWRAQWVEEMGANQSA